jgi:hypothetical protein
MKKPSRNYDVESPADYLEILYRRHFQGALVRSGASVIMWLFALVSFLARVIDMSQFKGITLSVGYLILMNPPTLLLLKRITHMHLYRYASLLINFLEVLGYTAIIYFVGGIEAPHLTLIYAALITYVGAMAPWSFPYVIAIMCSAAFSFVLAGEYFGFLSRYSIFQSFDLPLMSKLTILSVVIALLFVIAYISSLTAATLRKNRNKLREKNLELRNALSKIKTLSGMLPICASCKKIRDDKGYWNQIESYIKHHSEAEFSHSICPECAKILYPEYYNEMYPESDK